MIMQPRSPLKFVVTKKTSTPEASKGTPQHTALLETPAPPPAAFVAPVCAALGVSCTESPVKTPVKKKTPTKQAQAGRATVAAAQAKPQQYHTPAHLQGADKLCREVIEKAARRGEFPNPAAVQLELIGMGLRPNQVGQTLAFKTLTRRIQRVETFTHAYFFTHGVRTMHDLRSCIVEEEAAVATTEGDTSEPLKEYEQLCLGSFQNNPTVRQFFQLDQLNPPMSQVPVITETAVFEELSAAFNDKKRLEIDTLLGNFAKKLHVPDHLHLGVSVCNGLFIDMYWKAKRWYERRVISSGGLASLWEKKLLEEREKIVTEMMKTHQAYFASLRNLLRSAYPVETVPEFRLHSGVSATRQWLANYKSTVKSATRSNLVWLFALLSKRVEENPTLKEQLKLDQAHEEHLCRWRDAAGCLNVVALAHAMKSCKHLPPSVEPGKHVEKQEKAFLKQYLDAYMRVFNEAEDAFANFCPPPHTGLKEFIRKVSASVSSTGQLSLQHLAIIEKAIRESPNYKDCADSLMEFLSEHSKELGLRVIVGGVSTVQPADVPDDLYRVLPEKRQLEEATVSLLQDVPVGDSFTFFVAEVEKRLKDQFAVHTFAELGFSSLLELAASSLLVTKELDAICSTCCCRSLVAAALTSCAAQFGDVAAQQTQDAVASNFGVASLAELGVVAPDKFAQSIQKKQQRQRKGGAGVVFVASLLAGEPVPKSLPPLSSVDDALATAPPLSSLADMLCWSALYTAEEGSLDRYMQVRVSGDSKLPVPVLCTGPGMFYTLIPHASEKLFRADARAMHVRVVAQLVSIVAQKGSLLAAPLSTLAHAFRESLVTLWRKQESKDSIAKWLLQCVLALPEPLCWHSRLVTVFLPFHAPVGNEESASALDGLASLVDALPTCCDESARPKLYAICMHCGFTQWEKYFPRDTLLPASKHTEGSVPQQRLSSVPAQQPSAIVVAATPTDEVSPEGADADDTTEPDNDVEAKKALIQRIREELGIGVPVEDPRFRVIIENLQSNLGNSVQLLGVQQNSRVEHFVYEVIQNAEDNRYRTDTVPTLEFLLQESDDDACITLLNNEAGFTESDVRAICSVGRSTKQTTRQIGCLGIGFKSVFRATNAPEVHSNGYHIRFTRDDSERLRLLVPQWADVPTALTTGVALPDARTRIVLPLKSGCRRLLSDVKWMMRPTWLLFLRKLQRIVITHMHGTDTQRRQLVRVTGGAAGLCAGTGAGGEVATVCDSSSGVETSWIVTWRDVQPTDQKPESKRRVEVTRVCVALPLEPLAATSAVESVVTTPSGARAKAERYPVFAFLPLKDCGFKFIIQADWAVTSSREDVDSCEWNECLRNAVAAVFMDAFKAFISHHSSSDSAAFTRWKVISTLVALIPDEEEIDAFFKSVAREILTNLRGTAWLPCEGADGEEVCLQCPDCVVIPVDDEVVRLVPAVLLRDFAGGAQFLHHHVKLSPQEVNRIGLHYFTPEDLVSMMACMHAQGQLDRVSETQLVSWLAWIANTLGVCHSSSYMECNATDIYTQLRQLPVVVLEGRKQRACTEEDAVFFPPADKCIEATAFLHEMNIAKLPESESLRHSLQIVFEKIGVLAFTPREVVSKFVLASLAQDSVLKKQRGVVAAYLAYCKLAWVKLPSCGPERHDLEQKLRKSVALVTNKGVRRVDSAVPVHLHAIYGRIKCLAAVLGPEAVFVAPDYLNLGGDPASWVEFFSCVGVQQFLHITSFIEEEAGNKAKNFECTELRSVLQRANNAEIALPDMVAFTQALCEHWDGIAPYCFVESAGVRDVPSRLLLDLRENAWVPCLKSRKLLAPAQIYLYSEEVEAIMMDTVDYVNYLPASNLKDFVSALGIKRAPFFDSVVGNIRSWKTNVRHMTAVYRFLMSFSEELPKLARIKQLAEEEFFFISHLQMKLGSREVFIRDDLGIVNTDGSGRAVLQDDYVSVDLLAFFQLLGVATTPPPEEYTRALVRIVKNQQHKMPRKELTEKLLIVLAHLQKLFRKDCVALQPVLTDLGG
eukprot:TRINITY_DN5810_c0_g1_i3.p1 TRINITY_DN5810_c0_g1~~TRINITY_DN5810_c0_g1_i3.p1  ORF type:complete len:2010 (+),score=347.50 TRINITY_DN5810_c0_g1_i3:71-6100(+)